MAAGWVAVGPDSQAAPEPAQPQGADNGGWTAVGPDQRGVPAAQAKPVNAIEDQRGIYQTSRDFLFGHTPDDSDRAHPDADRTYKPGVFPSAGRDIAAIPAEAARGPEVSTLASSYPHLVGAHVERIKGGYSEAVGATQVNNSESDLAALSVLPQAIARLGGKGAVPDYEALAKDPLVRKAAIGLGQDPKTWAMFQGPRVSSMSPEAQADAASDAQATLAAGKDKIVSGKNSRAQAWADERAWYPSDLKNGKLDPWSLKGAAFNTALAIPDLALVSGATVATTAATGNPVLGVGAGGLTAAAIWAPEQRAGVKDKIDEQVDRLMSRADELDAQAPIGGKRGLNPVTIQLRQQAADLAASSDKIADTAGFLYAVSDAAGAVPVAAVLAKVPGGQTVINKVMGAAVAKTMGGRVASSVIANGGGAMLQTAIQKGIDAGIIHESQPLGDALKDIAYTGVIGSLTALPIAGAHEIVNARGQRQQQRDFDTDQFAESVRRATDNLGKPKMAAGEDYPGYTWNETNKRYEETNPAPGATKALPGATNAPQGETPAGETPQGGAGGKRQAYQQKIDTLNEAAAGAEKRSDVTLQPEEDGWSIHVKGQPVAAFDNAVNAKQALANARKLVGTKVVQPQAPESVAEEAPAGPVAPPPAETSPGKPTTFQDFPAAGESERVPEDALERTQPVQAERRSDTALRTRVNDMSLEQARAALSTHELTGLPNRRAYEDSEKKPAQVSIDVDSLKWMNDNAGHPAGDQLLKAVGQALHEASAGNAYHISGDEFVVQGDSAEQAEATMARAKSRLAGATLVFEHPTTGETVEVKGIGVSHGTGRNLSEADAVLAETKSSRERSGERAGRGEQPPTASRRPSQAGLPAENREPTPGGGGAAPGRRTLKVLGQDVEAPHVPSAGQAAAGNYFKPTVKWRGLPIKIENEAGSTRGFRYPNGRMGQRVMRDHYGYFPGKTGADGDGVDVFMGPAKGGESGRAYVIDQLAPGGRTFDEHKVVVGVASAAEAKKLYLSNYQKDWKGFGAITPMDHDALAHWLDHGDLTKPVAWSEPAKRAAPAVRGPSAAKDSILQYLARHDRGLDSDEAVRQGIDPADMKLAAAHVGIRRAFRKNGMTFDEAAEHLHEAGYPVHDEDGHYNPNTLLDKLGDELGGRRHFSVHNKEAFDARAAAELERLRDTSSTMTEAELDSLTAEQLEERLDALEAQNERLAIQAESREGAEQAAEHDDSIPFAKRPGVQVDLFGAQDHIKTELKKLEAALDKKRNGGGREVSVETGDPTDLFSQARKQVDLEDKPKTAGKQVDLEDLAGQPWQALEPIEIWHLSAAEIRDYAADSRRRGQLKAAKEAETILANKEADEAQAKAHYEASHGRRPVGDNQENFPYVSQKTKGKGALEDAGEKIGGARKDRWAERGLSLEDLSSISESEAAGLVNKKAVFNPDWEKIVAAGMPKDVAALAKVLLDQLGARPRLNTPVGRRDYVETLGEVRAKMLAAKNQTDIANIEMGLVRKLGMPTGSAAFVMTDEQKLARDKFWSIQKGRRSSLHVAQSDYRKVRQMLEAGWPAKAVKAEPGTAETKKPRDKQPERPHLDHIDRVGPPVRGADVASQDFIKAFGFRGLEFGNWAASDERQKLMNHAYEGLHDLARVIGVPARALSLNGTMGLALGARGGGRFAAHYEPGRLVINMTKINGAGALAHEWGHAVDHYFGEFGRPDAYSTDARGASGWYHDPTAKTLAHLRPELQEAFRGVLDAMFKTHISKAEGVRDLEIRREQLEGRMREIDDELGKAVGKQADVIAARLDYYRDHVVATGKALDAARLKGEGEFGSRNTKYRNDAGRLGEYWRRPTEMFARAFEAFVHDKITAEGNTSQYLVHGNEEATHADNPKGNPYPTGADRVQIDAAFQKLMDAMKTREEDGKTLLFSKSGQRQGGLHVAQVQRRVAAVLKHFRTKPADVIVVPNSRALHAIPELQGRLEGNDTIGLMDPRDGKLYLVADHFTSPTQVASLLAHEYIVHFGIRAAFGNRRGGEYQRILQGVAKVLPFETEMRFHQAFPGGDYAKATLNQKLIAAEEALAYTSEDHFRGTGPGKAKSWVDKWHALIRDWLRSVFGLAPKFDKLFVRNVLNALKAHLQAGKKSEAFYDGQPRQARAADTFYSAVGRAVDAAKRDKGTGAEWEATLRNTAGVKKEEMEWLGLKDWLDGRGRVSKAEVSAYVQAHQVRLEETRYGGPGTGAKFSTQEIESINDRMGQVGLGDLEGDQIAALMAGGQDAEDVLEQLHRMGADVADLTRENRGREEQALTDELKELGYEMQADPNGHLALREIEGRDDEHVDESEDARVDRNEQEYDRAADILAEVNARRNGQPARYFQHATPGGKNYGELLIKLAPRAKDFYAKRKAVFDAHNPQIAEHETAGADYTLSSAERAEHRAQANELREARDKAANAVQRVQETYNSPHWQPEENVLAHVRYDERTGPAGERILHLNELQSDWHQGGRRHGYAGDRAGDPTKRPTQREMDFARSTANTVLRGLDNLGYYSPSEALTAVMAHPDWATRWDVGSASDQRAISDYVELLRREAQHADKHEPFPEAPFKTTWPELIIKRMLRMAAEKGYDALTWDTGDTNADRYNMSQVVDRIRVDRDEVAHAGGRDVYRLIGTMKGRSVLERSELTAEKLVELVGKDMAQKAVERLSDEDNRGAEFKGDELKVGGAGMRAFYDTMLPAKVQALVKKWGASVGSGKLGPADVPPKYEIEARAGQFIAYNPLDQYDFKEFDSHAAALEFQRNAGEAERFVVGQDTDKEWRVVDTRGDAASQFAGGAHQDQAAAQAHANALNRVDTEKNDLVVHRVNITPAMRDSLMEGQPMFRKKNKGPAAAPVPKGPGRMRRAYTVGHNLGKALVHNEFVDSFRRLLDPANVSEFAKVTAMVTRENLGELAQEKEVALHRLEEYAKAFDLLAVPDRMEFIHAMEEGRPQPIEALQPAADTIRALLDDWRERVRELGVGALENWIENYFPHIWADDAAAKKLFGQVFGRRPLKGPASFLKQRTIPTTREGIEKGLKPVSTNPLILAFAKIVEMQRFVAGVKLMQRYKDEGLAVFLPANKMRPEGWAEIKDAVGRVLQWNEAEGAFMIRGSYIMPADGARVINNHLGGSALRNFMPAQVFRTLSNAVNALQLGFSGFHFGFTTYDAIISKNALAVERLAHGEPLRAAMAFLETASVIGAPALNLRRGWKLMQAYSNIADATPEMAAIVQGLKDSGGRVKMDNYHGASQGKSPFKGVGFANLAGEMKAVMSLPEHRVREMTKVVGGFPREYAQKLWNDLRAMPAELKWPILTMPFEIAGRVTRASTSLLMEHIVPMQKLGVFSDLASDWLRRNPDALPVARSAAMQAMWNSVDNRLGEMVYDNLFWDRTFKDVNHIMVRAVGWNLGTIRELGGAPVDAVKLLDYMARGAPAEPLGIGLDQSGPALLEHEQAKSTLDRIADKLGHKITYTLALIGTTMVVGAAIQYLLTGEGPKEIKDYFFPRTGRPTKYGTPERISQPTYAKDVYEYSQDAVQTVINKANPVFGIIHAIYANEDFYGNPVRNPDGSKWEQMKEGAMYAGREVAPFSIQGQRQYQEAGAGGAKGAFLAAAPYIGFGPAPARVTSPEAMEAYQHEELEKGWVKGLRRQLKAAQEKGDTAKVAELQAQIAQAKAAAKRTGGEIKQNRAKAKQQAEKIGQLTDGKSKADSVAALKSAGMPALAALWEQLPDRPRERVANSLQAFA